MTEALTNNELTTIGTRFFPGYNLQVHVSSANTFKPADAAEPRLAICLVEEGSAVLEQDGQKLLLTSPCLLVMGETARPDFSQEKALRCSVLYFHPAVVNAVFSDLKFLKHGFEGINTSSYQDLYLFKPFLQATNSALVFNLSPGNERRMSECLRQLRELTTEQPHNMWPCMSRSYLIELLFSLQLLVREERPQAMEVTNATDSRLDLALQLVQERFNEPLSLEQLARHCASNRTSLNRHFHRRTGMTMRHYLVHIRLTMAANLLRSTQLPISEIASRVGYESVSHFSRAFRNTHGKTPSNYRQNP